MVIQEGFPTLSITRLTTNADETITRAGCSLSNEEGSARVLCRGQGSVEAIFNAIDKFFNQTVRLTSYNIDAVTDGIDAQARVLVSVENVDTDTIFNALFDFDGQEPLPSLISMPTRWFKKRMRVRWDELSPTVIFHKPKRT